MSPEEIVAHAPLKYISLNYVLSVLLLLRKREKDKIMFIGGNLRTTPYLSTILNWGCTR